jgi:hypothetical protein
MSRTVVAMSSTTFGWWRGRGAHLQAVSLFFRSVRHRSKCQREFQLTAHNGTRVMAHHQALIAEYLGPDEALIREARL